MPLPTLLQPGFLIPPKNATKAEKEKLKQMIPIDYIINFFSDRIPQAKNGKPKIPPKRPGDKIYIAKSSTGSGKSTVLPTYLYKNFVERTHKNIICSQPRVLTAIDIPLSMIQYEKTLQLDKNIGYNTGKFKRLPAEKGIIYCTPEIITQQYLTAETVEDFMKMYSIIIIDEVHNRSIAEDALHFLMKKLITENYDNPDCPFLILTSATFDERIFIDYYGVPKENYVEIEGFAYPKTEFYPKYDITDYQSYATKKILQVHLDNTADIIGTEASIYRDIILFVPTSTVGEKIMKELMRINSTILDQDLDKVIEWKNKELDKEIEALFLKNDNPQIEGGGKKEEVRAYLLPILLTKKTFEAGGLEYQNMFSPIDTISLPIWKLKPKQELDMSVKPDKFVRPSRRVIISSPLSETGITIDSLKMCIDTGYVFEASFMPDYGAPMLVQKGCTQGMAIQRKGRVGRKSPGYWWPMFTKDTFEKMQKDQFAEIIMTDPTDNLLSIIINETATKLIEEDRKLIISSDVKRDELGLFQRNAISDQRWWAIEHKKSLSIGAMDFLEMPSGPALQYATEKLHALGMIDDGYNITLFGYLANLIRFISLESKRMIFAGFNSGASIMDLITAAAFIYTGKRILYDKKFKMPNVLDKPNFDFIYRVLIGDELIGAILLWNDFNDWISAKITKAFKSGGNISKSGLVSPDAVKEWCLAHGILYEGWIAMIANRDVLLENLITIGVNVYFNTHSDSTVATKFNLKQLLKDNLEEGLDEVRKIKEAIYAGYYLNLCQWNEKKRVYMMLARSLPIQTKSEVLPYLNPVLAKQTKPLHIIVSNYLFTQSQKSATFEFSATSGFISVMDNYVSVDTRLNLA